MKVPPPFLYLFVLLSCACETVVDVDIPPEPTRLVVNSFISPDQDVGLRVTKSKSALDRAESFPLVNDAQVTLYEEGREVAQLTNESSGWYTAPFRPQAGFRYTVQVSSNGAQSVEATSRIETPTAIGGLTADTIQIESGFSCINDDCETNYSTEFQLQLQLTDASGLANYYEILGYTVTLDSVPQFDGAGNFTRYDTVSRRQRVSFVSDDPVVNNSASALGDSEFYGRSLIFSDEIFSGQGYTVDFRTTDTNVFYNGANYSVLQKLIIILRTLSEDQYQYLRTRDLQDFNSGNLFSEVVPVYNNIENGFGIFAGYSADSVVVEVSP